MLAQALAPVEAEDVERHGRQQEASDAIRDGLARVFKTG